MGTEDDRCETCGGELGEMQELPAGARYRLCTQCGRWADRSNICGGGCATCRENNLKCDECSNCMNVLLPLLVDLEFPKPC